MRHGDAYKHTHTYVAIGSGNKLAPWRRYVAYTLPILTYGQLDPLDQVL